MDMAAAFTTIIDNVSNGAAMAISSAVVANWFIFLPSTLVLAILSLYFFIPTWPLLHVPCPSPKHPLLGHLPLLEKHQAEVYLHLARQYGPVYRFHVGRQPLVMIADAELCRLLGMKKFKSAPNRSVPVYIESSTILKSGLFFSRDSRWSSMRNIVLPLYHSEQMCTYLPLMQRIIQRLVDILTESADKNRDLNFSEYVLAMTMDFIGEAAFGTEFGLLDDKTAITNNPDFELVDCVCKYVTSLKMDSSAPLSTVCGIFLPILQYPLRKLLQLIRGTADWEQETCTSKLTRLLDEIVERRAKEGSGRAAKVDALSLLLNARDASKESRELLTPAYVGALTFELLLTGSETTANTICFALYAIAAHPEVETKLLQEIDAFGPLNKCISADELQANFPYVEQVIKETLRLYAPAPVTARQLSEDIEIGGYHLPTGTWVWMALNAVMRDPKHFTDPEKFRPDRFDPDCEESKRRHPYAFIPFGLGPRTCIGYKLAMQEAKMALIHLYQKFTFEHSPSMERPLALQFGIVTKPKFGVRLRAHSRVPHPAPPSSP